MSEIKFVDAFANRPYQIMVKDNNCNHSSRENTRYKEDAIEIANIYLKTYRYVKIVYVPTGEIVWEAGDKLKNRIATLRNGERHVQLNVLDRRN